MLYWAQKENSDVAAFFKQYEGSSWYSNKLRDCIVVGGVLFLSTLGHFISRYYGRPITLSVQQVNATTGNGSTTYFYGETQQKNRTINLIISIKRKDTLNYLLSWYLKRYRIFILIKCNDDTIELQAMDEPLKENEVIPLENGTGFYIDISDYLKSIANHSCNAEPKKTIPFFIKETRTSRSLKYANSDQTTHINPVLVIDRNNATSKLLNIALNWNADQHEITYYNGR